MNIMESNCLRFGKNGKKFSTFARSLLFHHFRYLKACWSNSRTALTAVGYYHPEVVPWRCLNLTLHITVKVAD